MSGHVTNWFKRAQRGLYAGKTRLTGNNVSFSHRRTRRVWLPNVQNKHFYSELLDKTMRIRVTTHALRCIDHAGGLDKYLLGTKDKKLASEFGVNLKRQLEAKFLEKTGTKFDPKPLIMAKRQARYERTLANRAAKDAKLLERQQRAAARAEAEAKKRAEKAAAAAARKAAKAAAKGDKASKPADSSADTSAASAPSGASEVGRAPSDEKPASEGASAASSATTPSSDAQPSGTQPAPAPSTGTASSNRDSTSDAANA